VQTPREIFRKMMHYEQPERMLVWHWTFGGYRDEGWVARWWPSYGTHFWQNTIDRWGSEGLPAEVNTRRRVNDYFGVDRRLQLELCLYTWPPPEIEVLEETNEYLVIADADGGVERIFAGERAETSMPQYIRYPVTSREDWNCFAHKRLAPDSPGREVFRILKDGQPLIESAPGAPNFQEARDILLNCDLPVEVYVGSLYGVLRNWMGLTGISYALYDDEAWVREMMEYLTELTLSVLHRVLDPLDVPIDHAQWWEDMAYNKGPLISPAHVRRLMLPCYRRVNDYLHQRGIDVINVDSDGNLNELIPLWLEVGINCIMPIEVAAGNDVAALRAKYGRDLLMIGGIDKRALAKGKEAIREELAQRLPVVAQGGYIPEVDHSVPHDISFENYMYYHELLSQECAHYLRQWNA